MSVIRLKKRVVLPPHADDFYVGISALRDGAGVKRFFALMVSDGRAGAKQITESLRDRLVDLGGVGTRRERSR